MKNTSSAFVATMTKFLRRFFVKMTAKVRWVLLAYMVTRLLAAFLYQFVEGWTFMEGWWWGEVASLTIGYGDISPATTLGRLLASFFHFFWVYYIGLALGAHIIMHLIKDSNLLTHGEQEWMFKVITMMFSWTRWIVHSIGVMAEKQGITLLPPPHKEDGELAACPKQAHDTDSEDPVPMH